MLIPHWKLLLYLCLINRNLALFLAIDLQDIIWNSTPLSCVFYFTPLHNMKYQVSVTYIYTDLGQYWLR